MSNFVRRQGKKLLTRRSILLWYSTERQRLSDAAREQKAGKRGIVLTLPNQD